MPGIQGFLGALAAAAVAAVWLVVALISIAVQRRARANVVQSLATRCSPPLFTVLIAFLVGNAGVENFVIPFGFPLIGGAVVALVIAKESRIRGDGRDPENPKN